MFASLINGKWYLIIVLICIFMIILVKLNFFSNIYWTLGFLFDFLSKKTLKWFSIRIIQDLLKRVVDLTEVGWDLEICMLKSLPGNWSPAPGKDHCIKCSKQSHGHLVVIPSQCTGGRYLIKTLILYWLKGAVGGMLTTWRLLYESPLGKFLPALSVRKSCTSLQQPLLFYLTGTMT